MPDFRNLIKKPAQAVGSSWEYIFERELLWKQHGREFQQQCIEVATRFIEAGKVDQPKMRGENPPAAGPNRWIDTDTSEIVCLPPGTKRQPEYLLQLLDPEFDKQNAQVTARSSFR